MLDKLKMSKVLSKLKRLSKKTWLIIGGLAVLVVLIVAWVIVAVSVTGDNDVVTGQNEIREGGDTLLLPAADSVALRSEYDEIEATVTSDRIDFAGYTAVSAGEKVSVWLYSEPKFVGIFEVKEDEDGNRYIDGLAKALEALGAVDLGEHSLAIVGSSGVTVGYVAVSIGADGLAMREVADDEEVVSSEGASTGGTSGSGACTDWRKTDASGRFYYNLNCEVYVAAVYTDYLTYKDNYKTVWVYKYLKDDGSWGVMDADKASWVDEGSNTILDPQVGSQSGDCLIPSISGETFWCNYMQESVLDGRILVPSGGGTSWHYGRSLDEMKQIELGYDRGGTLNKFELQGEMMRLTRETCKTVNLSDKYCTSW